jgi:hypothetical protein
MQTYEHEKCNRIKMKGIAMKSLEKIDEIVKKIENTNFFKQFRQEEQEETLKTRQAAADKITALEAERNEILPKLQTALAQKEKALKQAQNALEKATVDYNRAKSEKWGRSHQFDYRINEQRNRLIGTASPEIDEGIEFFKLKLDWLRQPFRISHRAEGSVLNLVTLGRKTSGSSNLSAINGAIEYCQDAIRKLNEMKFEPSLDAETIETLKNGIPSIDVYSEISGERAPKKLPVDNTVSNLVKKVGRLVGSPA